MLFCTPTLIVSSTATLKNQEHFSRTLNAFPFPFLTGLFLATPAVLVRRAAYEILHRAALVVTAFSVTETGRMRDSATLKSSAAVTLLISTEPNTVQSSVPLYLLALIPLANFLFLLTFLKFGRWYMICGVTATLFILATYLPGVYVWVESIFMLPCLIICLWFIAEALFVIVPSYIRSEWHGRDRNYVLFNEEPGTCLISVCWLNLMGRNGASAKLLASQRVVDTLFSAGMLMFYFLI